MVDQFWQGVNKRTKLIFLSHITSPTALRLPVEMICARANEAGILTMLDGAHAPGQIPLNLKRLTGRFLYRKLSQMDACTQRIWLFIRPPTITKLDRTIIVSWGFRVSPELSSGSRFMDMLTWAGTHDPSAYLTVPAAIQFMEANDWTQNRRRCHQELAKFLPDFSAVTGKEPVYRSDQHFGQMATIELPQVYGCNSVKNRFI